MYLQTQALPNVKTHKLDAMWRLIKIASCRACLIIYIFSFSVRKIKEGIHILQKGWLGNGINRYNRWWYEMADRTSIREKHGHTKKDSVTCLLVRRAHTKHTVWLSCSTLVLLTCKGFHFPTLMVSIGNRKGKSKVASTQDWKVLHTGHICYL